MGALQYLRYHLEALDVYGAKDEVEEAKTAIVMIENPYSMAQFLCRGICCVVLGCGLSQSSGSVALSSVTSEPATRIITFTMDGCTALEGHRWVCAGRSLREQHD